MANSTVFSSTPNELETQIFGVNSNLPKAI